MYSFCNCIISARVNISVPLGERSHREGAVKESVKNSLEASAAKITSAPVGLILLFFSHSLLAVQLYCNWLPAVLGN